MRKCSRCKKKKPTKDFYRSTSALDGIHSHCKDCHSFYYRKNRGRNLKRMKENRTKARYGISVAEYDELISRGCSVCGPTDRRIVLDHCHSSNKIREPLCDNCNWTLGLVGENPEKLRNLAKYLERHT